MIPVTCKTRCRAHPLHSVSSSVLPALRKVQSSICLVAISLAAPYSQVFVGASFCQSSSKLVETARDVAHIPSFGMFFCQMVAVQLEACVEIVNGSTTIPLEVTLHHMLCWLLIPRGSLFVLLARENCFFHVSQLQSCSKFFVAVYGPGEGLIHRHPHAACTFSRDMARPNHIKRCN